MKLCLDVLIGLCLLACMVLLLMCCCCVVVVLLHYCCIVAMGAMELGQSSDEISFVFFANCNLEL